MNSTTNNDRKDVEFAVIRSYQPTRIERELLAQVFELASQGVSSQSDATGSRQQPRARASQRMSEHDLAIPGVIDCRDASASQLERAA
jgi:hypothetical protein